MSFEFVGVWTCVCVREREIERERVEMSMNIGSRRCIGCYVLFFNTLLGAWYFFQTFSTIILGGKCRQSLKYRKIQLPTCIPLVLLFFTIFCLCWKSSSPIPFFSFFSIIQYKGPARNQLKWLKKKKRKKEAKHIWGLWTKSCIFFSVNWDFPLWFWSILFFSPFFNKTFLFLLRVTK